MNLLLIDQSDDGDDDDYAGDDKDKDGDNGKDGDEDGDGIRSWTVEGVRCWCPTTIQHSIHSEVCSAFVFVFVLAIIIIAIVIIIIILLFVCLLSGPATDDKHFGCLFWNS